MTIPVGNLVIEMQANVARVQKDMDAIRKSTDSTMGSITKSANIAMKALGALGLALSAHALSEWIQRAIDAADETNKLAQKIGMTVTEVAGIQLAFKQGGVDAEGFQKAMSKLSVGVMDNNKALVAMGIQTRGADGALLSTREIVGQVADKFASYEDGVGKTALAIELFGKSGADLIPVLNAGGDSLKEYDDIAKKLGLTISSETAASAEKFNDTMELVGLGSRGVATQIAAQLLPTLENLSSVFLETMTSGDALERTANAIANSFKFIVSTAYGAYYSIKDLGNMLVSYSQIAVEALTFNWGTIDTIQANRDSAMLANRQAFNDVMKKIWSEQGNAAVSSMTDTMKAAKRTAPEIGALADAAKKAAEDYEKMIKSADALVASIKFEADAYAMTNVEKETAIALQKLVNLGIKEGTEEYNKYSEALISAVMDREQMKALAEIQKKDIEDRKKAEEKLIEDRKKKEEEFADEIKSINNQIGQSLADALMTGGTNAKDFIVNMFKTMVLRPMLQPIITGVVGAFTASALTSNAVAAEGAVSAGSVGNSFGLMSMASNLKSAYDVVTGGFTSLGATVSKFVSELGASVISTAEAGSAMESAGLAMWDSASTIGSAVSVVAGIGAGLGIGNLISGGKSLVGGSSWSTVGGGTALGAAIGSVVPVLGTALGAAVGGAIGGLVNAAFGMGSKENTDSGIIGKLSASNPLGMAQYQEWQQKGGWFRSDQSGSDWTNLDPKLQKYLNNSVATTAIAVRQYADILKLPAKGIAEFSFEVKQSLAGLSAEEAQKAVDALLSAYGNALAASVTAEIGPFQRDGEEAGATLARLATSLQGVNDVFKTLNVSLLDASLYGADAASKLVDMFGGLDKFVSATDAYYQAFYTEQERSAKTTQQLSDVFSQLGLAMPTTNASFRAMVEAARAAGNDGLFAALIKLAPAFNTLTTALSQAVDNAFSALQGAIQSEMQTALSTIEKQKTIAESARQVANDAVTAFKSIFDYLKGQIADLLAIADPAQTSAQGFAFVRDALDTALNTGTLPDQGLLSDAVTAARASLSSENFATAFEMKRANMALAADLQQLQGIAGDQMTTAEEQLKVAEDQLSFLTAQAESTQAYYDNQLQMAQNQMNELRGINGGVLTVAEAMASFGAAVNASRMAAASATGNDRTAQVSQMYLDILGRAPDSGGLASWVNSSMTLDEIRAGIMNSEEKRLRGYASGGLYPGGLAMVGENGPELINFNRPGMVYNAAQTDNILSGSAVVDEVRALREENQVQSRAIVALQSRLTRLFERWDGSGLPETRVTA